MDKTWTQRDKDNRLFLFMNEESHIIKPSILLKFLGAKNLNLKIKNLEINSIHKDNSNFDITKIKKLKVK